MNATKWMSTSLLCGVMFVITTMRDRNIRGKDMVFYSAFRQGKAKDGKEGF
jgi:hypothetical protein